MVLSEKISIKYALEWVLKSIKVNGGKGSSAFFHLWEGWSDAYPETSGYLIETLLEYHTVFPDLRLDNLALGIGEWLISIQNPDGSFPAGLGGKGEAVIFDTAQIIFGLNRLYKYTIQEKYKTALLNASKQVVSKMRSSQGWSSQAFVEGFVPLYYTRVIWALLEVAGEYDELIEYRPYIHRELDSFIDMINEDFSVENWGFKPLEPAYIHTIAYIWRGFLESALITSYKELLMKCYGAGGQLMQLYNDNNGFAGSYDQNWEEDNSYRCLVGEFQLSIFFYRLYQISKDIHFREVSYKIFYKAERKQWRFPLKGLRGGIPGSFPIYGKYQKFKLINWGAKFYLDAAYLLSIGSPTLKPS